MKRTKIAKRIAKVVTSLTVALLLLASINWQMAVSLFKDHENAFKIVGLAIGPFLAVLGFFWGLVDKAELKDLAEELGKAKERADAEKTMADQARSEVAAKVARIESLEHDLSAIANSGRLWKLRKNDPFPEYRGWKYDPVGAKIVTVGLFKGGVGKTHLASNFAAYVSEKQQKPVLLIDLDYQGSLSTSMLLAAGIEPVGSAVDALFEADADLATLASKRIHLAKNGPATVINHGNGLSRAWLVPADYTLAEVESRLLVERVVHNKQVLDERYRLARLLLNPQVRREYAMIIIDTPPRMTLGTVNAFVASHAYIVPAKLDRVSSEAVRPFLTQVRTLSEDLELDLQPAGIVGTLTRQLEPNNAENRIMETIEATASSIINRDNLMLKQNLPIKAQITNNDDLGYFLSDGGGPLSRIYDKIFDDLWQRVMTTSESR